MDSFKQINNHIFEISTWLTEEIPLHVYLVKGPDGAVFIDSGIKVMFPLLLKALSESGISKAGLGYVLHTHSHHDHIGCNHQLKAATGCRIAAHEYYAHWHADFERHYQEFARPFPEVIEDNEVLRSEVLDFLDGAHKVDLLVDEGSVFNLGGGVELEAYRFSGHMMAELGWYEKLTGTLILGDVITLMDAPFIHGHLTVQGYRDSLEKINLLLDDLDIEQVLMAHFIPGDPGQTKEMILRARRYLDDIENVILKTIASNGAIDLKGLWRSVCNRLGKIHEFRALSTVHAHVEDLKAKNIIIEHTNGTFSLKKHEKI